MSTWGRNDVASNSVISAVGQYNKTSNTANRDSFYGNTTHGAYVNAKVGQFGVDATEMGVANGSVVSYTVTGVGSGYFANAVVTVSGNATANATANSTGRISAVNVVLPGNSYSISPTVTIAAPSITFDANAAVTVATDFIGIAGNVFQANDRITYRTATGNTVLAGLANNTTYFAKVANSTGVTLSLTPGGAQIDLTAKGLTETGHSLIGETATAVATINGLARKGFHAGWVVRTEGTGGRAGRVQYETIVAMGSITGDGADDAVIKDA